MSLKAGDIVDCQ